MYNKIIPHLVELRKRALICLIFFIITSFSCYFFSSFILQILLNPLNVNVVIYTNLLEGFLTQIRISITSGCIISTPIWIYHIWKFVSIGLFKSEKKILKYCCIISPGLFLLGAIFAYYFISSDTCKFLLSFQEFDSLTKIIFIPKLHEYFIFIKSILISFGLCFQIPLIIFVCVNLNIIQTSIMQNNRKYAILISTIISAIIAPPDLISACIMSIIIYVIYELTLIFIIIFKKKI